MTNWRKKLWKSVSQFLYVEFWVFQLFYEISWLLALIKRLLEILILQIWKDGLISPKNEYNDSFCLHEAVIESEKNLCFMHFPHVAT